MSKTLRIAIIGNPNTGKSSVFNALTGASQKVGNFPGITVEKKIGFIRENQTKEVIEIIDLPGTYSLNANSQDEKTTVDVLSGNIKGEPRPDVILFIFDAIHLKRNLYLFSQVATLQIPIFGVVTMLDLQDESGIFVDISHLSRSLGIPIVSINARDKESTHNLTQELFQKNWNIVPKKDLLSIKADASQRYQWAGKILRTVETIKKPKIAKWQKWLDKLFTNTISGPISFLGIMFLMFQSMYTWAEPIMNGIEFFIEKMGAFAGDALVHTPTLAALVQDGIIGGVGFVLVFIPQIAILFFFIALLEETGYLARAAYLMDRLLSWTGLSGRSFVPMLSSFACAIPGIMSARVIKEDHARLTTILIAPFMSCSARLPVYILMISAIIEPLVGPMYASLVLLGMYFLGVLYALPSAFLLNKKVFKNMQSSFLLEIPRYRMPIFKNIFFRIKAAVWRFIKTAGTIILAFSILIWGLSYFPRSERVKSKIRDEITTQLSTQKELQAMQKSEQENKIKQRMRAKLLENSYLGKIGKVIEPIFEPLGFDWRITIGIIGAFPARELIISSLGIIFQVDSEKAEPLRERIIMAKRKDGSKLFTPLTALSLMIFFALCAQCMSTLITIARETNSTLNAILVFIYMTSLAYISSFIVYQAGKLMGYN